MKYVFAAILLVSLLVHFYQPNLTNDTQISQSFKIWSKLHSKEYKTQTEKVLRYLKYRANYIEVQKHNRRYQQGLETYDLQLNLFADLDSEEFGAIYASGLKKKSVTQDCTGSIKEVKSPPDSVDWTNIVTPVKNQGSCGSCWAFSANGALEGLYYQQTGTLVSFSEQQLVDCANGVYYNEGCNGGFMNTAFWYIKDNGITTNDIYPYNGLDNQCKYDPNTAIYKISDCAHLPQNQTAWLISAVVAQPVAVAVQADQLGFQLYRSGVFNGICGTNLNHGVVLLGYGDLNGKKYWKLKNSWGTTWGQAGYMLLARVDDAKTPGKCGIVMDNDIPIA